jgi:hypothetical protein
MASARPKWLAAAALRSATVLIVTLTLALSGAPATHARQSPPPPDAETLEAMHDAGIDFARFMDEASRQKQRWETNYGGSEPAPALLARARGIDGSYRLLAVSVDACSDSVNTIPYIAGLVDAVDQLEMQIVDADVGRLLMDTYRTPDDRGATPTVVILNESFEAVGAWVERPASLQDWWLENPELSTREKVRHKQVWYDADRGAETLREIIELIEAAEARSRRRR